MTCLRVEEKSRETRWTTGMHSSYTDGCMTFIIIWCYVDWHALETDSRILYTRIRIEELLFLATVEVWSVSPVPLHHLKIINSKKLLLFEIEGLENSDGWYYCFTWANVVRSYRSALQRLHDDYVNLGKRSLQYRGGSKGCLSRPNHRRHCGRFFSLVSGFPVIQVVCCISLGFPQFSGANVFLLTVNVSGTVKSNQSVACRSEWTVFCHWYLSTSISCF